MMDAGAAMKTASSMPGGGGNNPLMQGAGLGIGMAMAGQFMPGHAQQGVPPGAAALGGGAVGGANVDKAQLRGEIAQALQALRDHDVKAALQILDRLVQQLS
jgi:hypothetical protein